MIALSILDKLYNLPENSEISNEMQFFESVYLFIFWIRYKFYINTLYLSSHSSSFNYIAKAMDYNRECTTM
jgi:hypothetical protein